MDKNIYELAQELRDAISQDPRIISLNYIERMMESNEDVQRLSYLKDMAVVKYSDMLNFYQESASELKPFLKDISTAKIALQTHPLVKDYLNCFKEVRDLYNQINSILFTGMNLDLCQQKK